MEHQYLVSKKVVYFLWGMSLRLWRRRDFFHSSQASGERVCPRGDGEAGVSCLSGFPWSMMPDVID